MKCRNFARQGGTDPDTTDFSLLVTEIFDHDSIDWNDWVYADTHI